MRFHSKLSCIQQKGNFNFKYSFLLERDIYKRFLKKKDRSCLNFFFANHDFPDFLFLYSFIESKNLKRKKNTRKHVFNNHHNKTFADMIKRFNFFTKDDDE